MLVSIKADLYELGAPDVTGFPGLDTDDARLIVAAFGKDGPPVAAKRLTVKGRQFPVTVELTVDDLAFPLTKARGCGIFYIFHHEDLHAAVSVAFSAVETVVMHEHCVDPWKDCGVSEVFGYFWSLSLHYSARQLIGCKR